MVAFAEKLEQIGIASVRFDASGFGESDGNCERDFRVSSYLQDVHDVYRYVVNQPFVDPDAIGIVGHSLGGCLSLIFAAQTPAVKACCAVQPCTKLTRPGSSLDLETWRSRGCFERVCDPPLDKHVWLPVEFAEDADQINALDYAGQIKIPTCILYGHNDVDVLPSDTISIYEKLSGDKVLIGLDGVDHAFKRNHEHLEIVASNVVEFFQRKLSPLTRTCTATT